MDEFSRRYLTKSHQNNPSRTHGGRRAFPCMVPEQGLRLTREQTNQPVRRRRVFLSLVCLVFGLVVLQSAIFKTPITRPVHIAAKSSSLLRELVNATTTSPNRNMNNSRTTQVMQLENATEVGALAGGNISRDWCSCRDRRGDSNGTKYFLTAVVKVRIYAGDVIKFTIRELVQWLHYLSYAGVEHVYVYDSYLYKNESQRENLRCFVENGFVTYVNWSHTAVPNKPYVGQQEAYQDCLDKYGHEYIWQTSIDIDEYPFGPKDQAPGFLSRIIKQIRREQKRNLGQIFMQNFLFLGKPLNDTEHPLLIDRQWRRILKPWSSQTVKPIFLSKAVRKPMVHKPHLRKGYVGFFPKYNVLRLNHYHGERHKAKTEVDRGMETAVSALETCHERCPLGCCR